MSEPTTHAVEAAGRDGAAAQERQFNLLRQIAIAGGTIAPEASPNAEYGYTYVALGDDVERDLDSLARRDYLEARFYDRVSLCPKCDSHHLNVREICPGCRQAHLASEGLLHHFRCGYVGIPSEFSPAGDGSFACPKCNGRMEQIGSDYDRLGKAFACRSCGLISEIPPVEAVCLACGVRTPAENLVSRLVFRYVLTSRGAAAVRSGALLDDGVDVISIAGAAVYRRNIILEFLEHERQRLQYFNTGFSLLLIRCTAVAMMGQDADTSRNQWLTRLRQGLRSIDRIGQVADAVYLVILPQTRRRAAETLRQRIIAELGPQSPFSLSTVEVTKQQDLTPILAGRYSWDESS